MLHRPLLPIVFSALLLAGHSASARLGETEAQAQARYGTPTPELIGPTDKPLLVGAKELAYNYQGWRVRAAYVNNVTVRIEYAHLPENNTPKQISETEVKAVLEAEKGTFSWREQKPKTGNKDLDNLKNFFGGRVWERSDHAEATLKVNLLLELQSRDAEAIEKKLAKQPAAATGGAVAPKF